MGTGRPLGTERWPWWLVGNLLAPSEEISVRRYSGPMRRSVLVGSAVLMVLGLTVGLRPMGAAAQPFLPRAGLHDAVATTRQFPDLHAIVRWTENDIRETAIAPVTQALIVSTTDGVAIERGAGGTLGSPNQVVD